MHDVERTLVLAVLLVILVVFAFLRNLRATLIPVVAVSVSLIATFAAMYLLGYSLDNLSLMALTVATGFVVDDAIVVLENITRHIEDGMSPVEAALKGAGEVGFTVLSMSISLIAVFIPILHDGRHHRPPVPRIRDGDLDLDHDLAGDLARDDTDDVRDAAPSRNRRTWPALSTERTIFRCHARCLSAKLIRRAPLSQIDHFRRSARWSGSIFIFTMKYRRAFFRSKTLGPS